MKSRPLLLLPALLLWLAAAPAAALDTGELAALRERALSLVNEARQVEGLAPLEAGDSLAAAAQKHAEDMALRDYYAHASPEGETVRDRFRTEGGSDWQLVAENIATCRRCEPPPDETRVQAFHEGWMDSPPHRENILAPGLTRFGFGIAGTERQTYAVQTFAGPGQPRGLAAGAAAEPL
ncbi:MAG: CAP domain-containing protein, partial [Tistlia sp.]